MPSPDRLPDAVPLAAGADPARCLPSDEYRRPARPASGIAASGGRGVRYQDIGPPDHLSSGCFQESLSERSVDVLKVSDKRSGTTLLDISPPHPQRAADGDPWGIDVGRSFFVPGS